MYSITKQSEITAALNPLVGYFEPREMLLLLLLVMQLALAMHN